MPLQPFFLALDWTPNVNHAGFFLAKARGLYAACGLDVHFIAPHQDGYKLTPASRVCAGSATLAICPSETVVSYATSPSGSLKTPLTAVAAVLSEDTSAIVTLNSSGIDHPALLDGKRYASYGARYEGRIVQQVIRNGGGTGDYIEDADMPMLGIWDTLLAGNADATWVFMAWEGVIAKHRGVQLNVFTLSDSKVPYGYSPVLVASASRSQQDNVSIKAFLAASAMGWRGVVDDPVRAAAECLSEINATFDDLPEPIDAQVMELACQYIVPSVMPDKGNWGTMDAARWDEFLDWLSATGLLTEHVQSSQPVPGVSVSLDDLRSGLTGGILARTSLDSNVLFTNSLL